VQRHGLHLNDVEFFPNLHGGTLRWSVGKQPHPTDRATAYRDEERRRGLTDVSYYQNFAGAVARSTDALRDLLTSLRAHGARVAGYGAAAKGSTLANVAGLDTSLVDFVVDRNPHKHGHYMPGTHQPIESVDALLDKQPDYVILFAWNFADEIRQQQSEYVRRGGRFILPLPTPEILA
jgi:hypothetical protein